MDPETKKTLGILAMHLKNAPSKYVLFLGAGASISSGYPSGQKLTDYLLEELYYHVEATPPEDSDVLKNWFEKEFQRNLSLNSLMDEMIMRLGEESIADLIRPYFEDKKISSGYQQLVELIQKGYFHVIFNMNFDHSLEAALIEQGIIPSVIVTAGDCGIGMPEFPEKPMIIKVHGDIEKPRTLKASSTRTEKLPKWMDSFLRSYLERLAFIFVGYSAQDKDILEVLNSIKEKDYKIFWVSPEKEPFESVKSVLSHFNSEKNYLSLGFDDFCVELSRSLKIKKGFRLREITREFPKINKKGENKPRLFLCHSSKDKGFVEHLAGKLLSNGFTVWYDDWEIHVGDSIVQKINEGISSSDFLLVVLSKNSVKSRWVREELSVATLKNIDSKVAFILPILLEQCEIPPLLSDKKYANFSEDPNAAYKELVKAINYHSKEIGKLSLRYTYTFKDIKAVIWLVEWLIWEIFDRSLSQEVEKKSMENEVKNLGYQVIDSTIWGNSEYIRIFNTLIKEEIFDKKDITELNKEKICRIFSGEDKDICCDFFESLKKKYKEMIDESGAKNMKSILERIHKPEKITILSEMDRKRIIKEIQILNSHYQVGEIGKALEVCKTLHQKYGPLEYVSEMEAVIYDEIGDLPNAERICQEYLEVFPNNFGMKLRLALLNFRSNKLEEVDEFLDSPFEIDNLPLEYGVRLAYLYAARNQDFKSFEIIYEMRRKFFNNSDAHLNYFHVFLKMEKDNEKLLSPSSVSIDTAVCIEDSSGKKQWYIIEDREDPDLYHKEINLSHPLTEKLLGRLVGDIISFRESPYFEEPGKIVEIKSKYVYAFQEIGDSYETLFPGKPGFWQIKLESPEKEGKLPENFLEILEKTTREQVEKSQKVEQFYKEGRMAIGNFAYFIERNVIDVWANLMNNPDLGIRCCLGTFQERNSALSLLKKKPRLIVDILSLMTLYRLDAGDVITKAFGKMGIAQSTVDLIQRAINEREGVHTRGYLTVGMEKNKFVKQLISAEDVKRSIGFFKDVLQWIENNCDIIPCKAALNIQRDKKEQLEKYFGRSFIDTILIASEPRNVLYSDDERLRSFAKGEFNVEGIWTQVLLMHCLSNSVLDRDNYNKMVVMLALSYYYFTSIDADVLIEAATQSNWMPTEGYKTVLRMLEGKKCDESSVLNISTDFFFSLWKQPIPVEKRDYLVLDLFDVITAGRDRKAVLNKLMSYVSTRFSSLPLAKNRIASLIDIWERMYLDRK